jgi:hypothetical protein
VQRQRVNVAVIITFPVRVIINRDLVFAAYQG